MNVRTKFELDDNLYFLQGDKIRFLKPLAIELTKVWDEEQKKWSPVLIYYFISGKGRIGVVETQLFKKREDLMKSLQ